MEKIVNEPVDRTMEFVEFSQCSLSVTRYLTLCSHSGRDGDYVRTQQYRFPFARVNQPLNVQPVDKRDNL